MGFTFTPIAKFLMILILPFLLFLLVLNLMSFDSSFYQKKFSEYGVQQNVPNAFSLHEKVMNFIGGKSNELPNEFNERERLHLLDVRNAVRISTLLLYALTAMFILLLIASALILKVNHYIINFVGKVLFFGGILTIALAAILFFLISFGFSSTFESFHRLLFEQGTYLFDPAKEMIVNLYPEQLFMDLGLRISKGVMLASASIILIGAVMALKSKSKKNKKIR
ncbi:DUF1461 domain-containing protein [Candidatus Woesearchaeota archaeon]|nr:DUF1461 domain-containing protein [Candidatus Woesearchaeota archaeon]